MIKKRVRIKPAHRPKTTSIKTTILDVIEELTVLTKDDALVMAAIKNIFATYDVRLARSSSPFASSYLKRSATIGRKSRARDQFGRDR
jgi:hypothetical protein